MKKMIFVFNPRSGKEQIRSKLLDILDIFTKYGYEVSVYVTQKPLDAMQIVSRRGRGRSLVVCSGGDGTLNEVVSGLMTIEEGKRPVLGYIPSGSTNDYASSIGISKNMKRRNDCRRCGQIRGRQIFCLCCGIRSIHRGFLQYAAGGQESSRPSGIYAGGREKSYKSESLQNEI